MTIYQGFQKTVILALQITFFNFPFSPDMGRRCP